VREANELLAQRSRAQLVDAAQRSATALHARLHAAQTTMEEAVQELAWNGALPIKVRSRLDVQLLNLATVQPSGAVVAHAGDWQGLPVIPPILQASLGDNHTRLLASTRPGEPARLFLLQVGTGGALIAAEVRRDYLWSSPPSDQDRPFCVLGGDGSPLHCQLPLSEAELRKMSATLSRADSGAFDWSAARHDWLVGYARVASEPDLQDVDWTVLLGEDRASALAGPRTLALALGLLLVGGAVVAALLGVAHARRSARSIGSLVAGTRRIAAQDFSARIELGDGDDLDAVAHALNAMADELGLEARARRVLAEIDRRLLEHPDLDHVVRLALSRLQGILSAPAAGLLLRSPTKPDEGRVYLARSRHAADVKATPTDFILPPCERRLLDGEGLWLQAPWPSHPLLVALQQNEVEQVYVVAVGGDQGLVGVLAVVPPPADQVSPHWQACVRQFADRLAMAFAAERRERQLHYHSRFDVLTGLPNRQTFIERLSYEQSRAQREGAVLAVMLVDLDRFKSINDTLGHAAGDDVIRQAGQRLKDTVRGIDTVARFGADEFALLLPGLAAAADAVRVGAQIVRRLAEPFLSEEHERVLGASVGVAVYPTDADSAEALVRNADTALHRAKEGSTGKVVLFEQRMNEEIRHRVTVERELRQALDRDEFVLYFQPQMDARTGALCGAEVLIRWQHPEHGLLSPAAFIDVAEQTGLIEPIGELVLRKACLQMQRWRAQRTALPRLSVNVSGRQFKRPDFAALVASILRETAVEPGALELEITETLLMEDADASGVMLLKLAEQGIRLAIDDFGTGYSSLAYLKRLHFDALKIDRSFVRDVTTDEDSRAIASAILALARTLRKETVAEGVETQEQLDFLRSQQCDLIQGFLISRPMPAEAFVAALHASETRTRSGLRLAATA